MIEKTKVAIIGAGPAGMAAADEAVKAGISAVVIDQFPHPGGNYYKQTLEGINPEITGNEERKILISALDSDGIELRSNCTVWGVFPENGGYLICLSDPDRTNRRLWAETLIVATGAYDRSAPFPGWTLPGVMMAGAALHMVKHQGVVPGKRVLISGTGPLIRLLAAQLIEAGSEVVGLLEANPFPMRALGGIRDILKQKDRLTEAKRATKIIKKAGIKTKYSYTILRAEGDGCLEKAHIGPINGKINETILADTVCLGYGLTPAVQLTKLIGAKHEFDKYTGSFIPVRDEYMQTDMKGLFAVGDGAAIGGNDTAIAEGRMALVGAALYLGIDGLIERVPDLRKELEKKRRFSSILQKLYPFPDQLWDRLSDDTIICRCEEITLGEIRKVIKEGADTVSITRLLTRAGMGNCQGRICGDSLHKIISRELDVAPEIIKMATPRAPVIPVSLSEMSEE